MAVQGKHGTEHASFGRSQLHSNDLTWQQWAFTVIIPLLFYSLLPPLRTNHTSLNRIFLFLTGSGLLFCIEYFISLPLMSPAYLLFPLGLRLNKGTHGKCFLLPKIRYSTFLMYPHSTCLPPRNVHHTVLKLSLFMVISPNKAVWSSKTGTG